MQNVNVQHAYIFLGIKEQTLDKEMHPMKRLKKTLGVEKIMVKWIDSEL